LLHHVFRFFILRITKIRSFRQKLRKRRNFACNGRRNSKLLYRVAACGGLVRCGPAGRELRASAGRRLRPAAAPYRSRKFIIQDSKFKITESGRSLRRVRMFGYELRASAGGSCGLHGPAGPPPTRNRPAAERTGVLSSSARMQPSARGRLRAAAVPFRNRKFRIQN